MDWACVSFVVFLLTISSLQTNCKRYDLPQGWSVKNDAELKEFEAASGIGHYRLIPAPSNAEFLSDNGTFALAFFCFNGTRSYYLSVIIGANYRTNSSKTGAVVWTANRNRPISENGSLRLGSDGAVELVDSDAKLAWSSPGAVSGVEMQEVGNMIFYNATSETVWQSFDEPTDVFFDGQTLRHGQRVWSNMNSSTMAEGNFQVRIELNGFRLYLSLPGEKLEVYFEWNLWNQGNAQSSVPCPGYEAVLQFNSSALNMFYVKNRTAGAGNYSKCGPDLSAGMLGSWGSLNYLKLDEAGNLFQFSFDSQRLIWTSTLTSIAGRIGTCLPLKCQSNSICRGNSRCDCLLGNVGTDNTTCPAPVEQPLKCNNLEAKNHYFMNISGASYFSNKYSQADKVSTVEDCWDLCLSNCSCRAFFYENQTASCYFLRTIHGSLSADATTTAFLKLQKSKLVYPEEGDNHDIMVITGSVGGSTLLVLIFLSLVAFWLWRKQANRIAGTLAAALQGTLRRYSYRELQVATSKFSSVIGSGASGSVYEGVLDDGRKVAVKQLTNTLQGQKEFIAEVNSIGSVSHMNIVKMCGFCAEKSHRMLVYEFAAKGSLDKWLFDEERNEYLDWKTRLGIALGVARGLAYLHEESTQLIMHLDIKPQNILLDEQFLPKLCDFGMSKLLANRETSQATSASVRGTPGYLAPEWLLHSIATRKCDVYSYGMVLLELIGGRRNFKKHNSNQQAEEEEEEEEEEGLKWYYPAWAVSRMRQGKLMQILDRRIAGEVGEEEFERVIRIALWCIQENQVHRPSMENVVQMLERRREVSEPPLEFHFALPSSGIISISTRSKPGGGISISTMTSN